MKVVFGNYQNTTRVLVADPKPIFVLNNELVLLIVDGRLSYMFCVKNVIPSLNYNVL